MRECGYSESGCAPLVGLICVASAIWSPSPGGALQHCSSLYPTMALSESGMHRAGLAFVYRIIPVLVATTLYGKCFLRPGLNIMLIFIAGIYIAVLCMATRGLM